jgi:hypothetical protein
VSDLARYQAALCELLARERDPDAIARALAEDPAFAPFRAYTATFAPRLVELTAHLVGRWAERPMGRRTG